MKALSQEVKVPFSGVKIKLKQLCNHYLYKSIFEAYEWADKSDSIQWPAKANDCRIIKQFMSLKRYTCQNPEKL